MTAAIEAVAIGGSAGAVQALLKVLPALPADYPFPVFVVLHVPPERDHVLAPLFAGKCALRVEEAADKEGIAGQTIYFAPADYHLLVESDRSFALSYDEPVNHSRPAIDVLLHSAADAYGAGLIGIVLSGANWDGASGLRAIAEAGGTALVQSPAEAEASAMPEAALAACPGALSLPLDGIVEYLLNAARDG